MSTTAEQPAAVAVRAPPFAAGGTYGKATRFTYIDALRGLAALAVAGFHFYTATGMQVRLERSIPGALDLVLAYGYLGVQVFFVLSGFVIAYSQRDTFVTAAFLGNFALRRSLRLDPPYWATIFMVLALNWAARRAFPDQRLDQMPGWPGVLANMAYLHDLLGVMPIVAVSWTLCIEVQFYLMLTLLVGLVQRIPGRARFLGWPSPGAFVVFVGVFVASVADLIGWTHLHWSIFLPHWYMFFLGALAWWCLDGKVAPAWFWICAGVVGAAWAIILYDRTGMALATAVSIYVIGVSGRLETLLSAAWLQFLGRISYSLYLAHAIVGGKVMKLGDRILRQQGYGESRVGAVALFVLAFAASIGGAYVFYRLIERPSVELTRRLKRKPKTVEAPSGFAGPDVDPRAAATAAAAGKSEASTAAPA